ncbi:MAG TPA: endonuclease Q family protein [Lacunisphaera sp.]|nr:endonuclease Q family protein [Lacunisphaera sp.]
MDNIAYWAQRKGLDLIGTGDCLQPQWLAEIEELTMETEPGWRMPKPAFERAVHARLQRALRRPLRFVLTTEVNCAPPGTDPVKGLHQLLYFPSVVVAREFALRASRWGDLQEGRPTFALSARDLLRETSRFDRIRQVAAHVMNPWFSVLGVVGGRTSLEEIYGDDLPRLWAVETGLTADPGMCRRVPGLDRFGLFSCSDAPALEKLGRECTLLDIPAGYDFLMAALRAGTNDQVKGILKVPLATTRHYLNWCSPCQASFDAHECPRCGQTLTTGSRDRMGGLAGIRAHPAWPAKTPPFEMLRPLAWLIAGVEGRSSDSAGVKKTEEEIVNRFGQPERFILTQAKPEDLLQVAKPEVVAAIVNQRTGAVSRREDPSQSLLGQGKFAF